MLVTPRPLHVRATSHIHTRRTHTFMLLSCAPQLGRRGGGGGASHGELVTVLLEDDECLQDELDLASLANSPDRDWDSSPAHMHAHALVPSGAAVPAGGGGSRGVCALAPAGRSTSPFGGTRGRGFLAKRSSDASAATYANQPAVPFVGAVECSCAVCSCACHVDPEAYAHMWGHVSRGPPGTHPRQAGVHKLYLLTSF